MAMLLIFLALQLCDAATTAVFLHRGVAEANPLVAFLLQVCGGPVLALAVFKTAACLLALYAWKTRRLRLLRRANFFFALCVGWNLIAIAIS